MLRRRRIMPRRVVAEQDHFDVLEPHHTVGFRPAPIIANAHAEVGAHRSPHTPTQIPDLEVALFQVLERAPGLVFGVPGQMDLAILADDAAALVDQDRGVETVAALTASFEFGKAQIEAEPQALRLTKQW